MTALVPINTASAAIFDVHPDIARAFHERNYVPAQIEQHLRWKAARARMGEGLVRLPAPRPTPAMFITPPRFVAETPSPSMQPAISAEDFLAAHWICDDWMEHGERPRIPKMVTIQRVVAEEFSITVEDLISPRRMKELLKPRMIAIYLARQFRPDSLPTIGRLFGDRDHTTIKHSVDKITADIQRDGDLAAVIERLKAKIGARL